MALVEYVLGFATDKNQVLLMLKNRPVWQEGKYNGIGGKIEEREKPLDAMIREFKEETDLVSTGQDWDHYVTIENMEWRIYVFRSSSIDIRKAESITDEQVISINISSLSLYRCLPSISWLVHLALDKGPIGSLVYYYDARLLNREKAVSV